MAHGGARLATRATDFLCSLRRLHLRRSLVTRGWRLTPRMMAAPNAPDDSGSSSPAGTARAQCVAWRVPTDVATAFVGGSCGGASEIPSAAAGVVVHKTPLTEKSKDRETTPSRHREGRTNVARHWYMPYANVFDPLGAVFSPTVVLKKTNSATGGWAQVLNVVQCCSPTSSAVNNSSVVPSRVQSCARAWSFPPICGNGLMRSALSVKCWRRRVADHSCACSRHTDGK